jgi:hypothetical protein
MRTLAAFSLCLIVAGCSTTAPISLNLPGGAAPGTAHTTSYTGTIDTQPCRGEFTGSPLNPTAPIALSCNDGRQGTGTVEIAGGQVVSGTIKLSDGKLATITPGPMPIPPRPTPLGSQVPLVRPINQAVSAVGGFARPAATKAQSGAGRSSTEPSASEE